MTSLGRKAFVREAGGGHHPPHPGRGAPGRNKDDWTGAPPLPPCLPRYIEAIVLGVPPDRPTVRANGGDGPENVLAGIAAVMDRVGGVLSWGGHAGAARARLPSSVVPL